QRAAVPGSSAVAPDQGQAGISDGAAVTLHALSDQQFEAVAIVQPGPQRGFQAPLPQRRPTQQQLDPPAFMLVPAQRGIVGIDAPAIAIREEAQAGIQVGADAPAERAVGQAQAQRPGGRLAGPGYAGIQAGLAEAGIAAQADFPAVALAAVPTSQQGGAQLPVTGFQFVGV